MMKVPLADVNSGKLLQRGKSITHTWMLYPALLTRFLDSALDWTAQVHGKGTLIYTYGDKFVGDWVDVRHSATETSRLTSVTWLASRWPLPTWAMLECKAKKEGEGELIYSNGDRFKGQTGVVTVWFSMIFRYFHGNLFNEASGPMIEQLAMEFSSTPTEIGTKVNGLMTSVRSSELARSLWRSAPQISCKVTAVVSLHVQRIPATCADAIGSQQNSQQNNERWSQALPQSCLLRILKLLSCLS